MNIRTVVFRTLSLATIIASGIGIKATPPQEVSGFTTITVKGHGPHALNALSFIGLGLTRAVVGQGILQVAGTAILSDLSANWSQDQFNGVNGAHYIEITSGPGAGLVTDIIATKSETKSLQTANDLSPYLTGAVSYKIRKHWTLRTLFGPQNEAGLGAGSNINADEILIYDPITQVFTVYYYKTAGLGGTGWRSNLSPSSDQSDAKLDLTRGIIIRRKQATDLNVKVFGVVKKGATYMAVHPGMNILANIYPTDTLTLGSSNLYTSDPTTGIAGGSNVTADKILIFNGTTYDTYYYKTQGLGGIGWRSTSSPSTDASDALIAPGSSIIIQRVVSRGAFYWIVEQPF
jgi:hypothetical protein